MVAVDGARVCAGGGRMKLEEVDACAVGKGLKGGLRPQGCEEMADACAVGEGSCAACCSFDGRAWIFDLCSGRPLLHLAHSLRDPVEYQVSHPSTTRLVYASLWQPSSLLRLSGLGAGCSGPKVLGYCWQQIPL